MLVPGCPAAAASASGTAAEEVAAVLLAGAGAEAPGGWNCFLIYLKADENCHQQHGNGHHDHPHLPMEQLVMLTKGSDCSLC